ncbi:MAG: hypothetical protein LBB63_02400 [Holosporaceae bacterium]|nr:hypothetical protein [Holosporaceae bacterium]
MGEKKQNWTATLTVALCFLCSASGAVTYGDASSDLSPSDYQDNLDIIKDEIYSTYRGIFDEKVLNKLFSMQSRSDLKKKLLTLANLLYADAAQYVYNKEFFAHYNRNPDETTRSIAIALKRTASEVGDESTNSSKWDSGVGETSFTKKKSQA